MNECQCASMRPGINTRPAAATTRTSALPSTVIGLVDMRSMMLPLTSTLEGADRTELLPSKMRTFSKSVATSFADVVPCARTEEDNPIPIKGMVATKARRDMDFITATNPWPQVTVDCRPDFSERWPLCLVVSRVPIGRNPCRSQGQA